jgi:hypothetical protein
MHDIKQTSPRDNNLYDIKSKFIKFSGPRLAFRVEVEKKKYSDKKQADYKYSKDWLSELPTDDNIVEML